MNLAPPNVDAPVRSGSRSTYILRLQQLLVGRGAPLSPDGVCGPETLQALGDLVATLQQSPVSSVRQLVAAGIDDATTASQLLARLTQALQLEDHAYGRNRQPPRARTQPLEPTQVISMGPREAEEMGRSLGILPSAISPAGYVAIGAGIFAAITGLVIWWKRGSRPERA